MVFSKGLDSIFYLRFLARCTFVQLSLVSRRFASQTPSAWADISVKPQTEKFRTSPFSLFYVIFKSGWKARAFLRFFVSVCYRRFTPLARINFKRTLTLCSVQASIGNLEPESKLICPRQIPRSLAGLWRRLSVG